MERTHKSRGGVALSFLQLNNIPLFLIQWKYLCPVSRPPTSHVCVERGTGKRVIDVLRLLLKTAVWEHPASPWWGTSHQTHHTRNDWQRDFHTTYYCCLNIYYKADKRDDIIKRITLSMQPSVKNAPVKLHIYPAQLRTAAWRQYSRNSGTMAFMELWTLWASAPLDTLLFPHNAEPKSL
jgi:hypothetical protein